MEHFVYKKPLIHADNKIIFGAGCFWGVERKFWSIEGVSMTSAGYAGGETKNPTYEEVCTGTTGHAEVVMVSYKNPLKLKDLLKIYWECHDPTQGMRQGNDIGSQYRSVIYCFSDDDLDLCKETRDIYQRTLQQSGFSRITTEIEPAENYFLAEEYHQQYLAKNPNGYCGIGGTGCAIEI
ncbi:MAG: peptide-methionine (S)-S-oxide reductase [SAR86 cluster bacterium SAR86B]|uniref:Peptide methionine sulfoxide reductase MsrA n=1 Tax=SAR86 cluster bacterium SAR86B TaxID=1123867 RepID=J5KFT3_9GAMM|nr:MAG: peptide-methionine (S)-S-oxide reductase [SAR86 cluster bacterium SAR86B]|tara:strand:+ start:10545 stop:11084 length:540 start_codon:yes stop_codon:yes gene_type:complete